MPLSVGFSNFEYQKLFLEVYLSLVSCHVIYLVELLVFDADDGDLAFCLVFAEGLHFDGLTFNKYADAVVGDEAIPLPLDAITPADDFVLLVGSCQHGLAIR